MAFSWSDVFDLPGLESSSDKKRRKGYEKAEQTIADARDNIKTAGQLQQEGRSMAGQAAADKAGQAKKQATAAAKMANVGRLAAATKGAAAAADASTEGYSEAASQNANLAESIQKQQLAASQELADAQRATADAEYDAVQKKKDRLTKTAGTIAGLFASSDGRFKNYKKHTYLKER